MPVLEVVVQVAGEVDDKRGFLPALMMTCSGCTPYGHGWPAGSGTSASNSMYSAMRVRTATAFCSTEKVLSWSMTAGSETKSRVTPVVIH